MDRTRTRERRLWLEGLVSATSPGLRSREMLPMPYSRNPGFTETRLRPLARRREMTARPLLVFIRVRNPCVLERRRRFGWNVRLGMKGLGLLS